MEFISALAYDAHASGLLGSVIFWTLSSILLVWYYRYSASRQNLPLPPGPKKLPFIGNNLDMPRTDQHITFARWAKEFGSDILHLKIAGENYIVLNSYEMAMDLLDKRSSIYSSRPHVTMLQDLIGWEGDLVYLPYGNEMKLHRKLFHQGFHPTDSSLHQPHHKKALRLFLNNLIDTPEEWLGHIQQMIRSIILAIAYGIHVLPKDDPSIAAAERMFSVLNIAGIPGSFFVDVFPILKYVPSWFPGASFKQKAKTWYGIRNATITPPFLQVKQAMAIGTAEDSFSLRCLTNAQNPHPHPNQLSEEEEMIKQAAGTLYEGGADTGITSLRTFVLAMMCFPDVQQEAQEELDRVIGTEQLPDYDDLDNQDSLPYLWAVIYECFRWQPIVPLAIPHKSDEEDTYQGYYIPKGSIVIPNVWAMLRDERTYGPTAHTFDPKRWLLQIQGRWKLNPDMHDPLSATFGFGRRQVACPGKHMGLSAFKMNVASLLHSFNITPSPGKDGNPSPTKVQYISGMLNSPAPFECSIKPRSAKHVALVRQVLLED
ncbi:cytochrome P450 [Lentinula guzmanii]|uniref:Cytochrome P450 n=1 Tax=Lentinula guzmanii TaxID=2804957 RepID=A0AA38JCB8_9AGAR|nr:cytochrome P450 [Lentinula guzmanii]